MAKKQEKRVETYSMRDIPYHGQVGAGRVHPFVPKDGVIAVPVPDSIPQGEHLGTMTVNGRSLERVGIYDGDIVLVRRITSKRQIKRNSICVVFVPSLGEVMAKKVSFDGDYIVLHYCGMEPQEPMVLLAEEVEIRGMVISVTKQQSDWHFVDEVIPSVGLLISSGARSRKVRAAMALLKKPVFKEPF